MPLILAPNIRRCFSIFVYLYSSAFSKWVKTTHVCHQSPDQTRLVVSPIFVMTTHHRKRSAVVVCHVIESEFTGNACLVVVSKCAHKAHVYHKHVEDDYTHRRADVMLMNATVIGPSNTLNLTYRNHNHQKQQTPIGTARSVSMRCLCVRQTQFHRGQRPSRCQNNSIGVYALCGVDNVE